MQTRRLGHSGLALSALTLGTLTWGHDTDTFEATRLYDRYRQAGGAALDVPTDASSPVFAARVETVRDVLDGAGGPEPTLVMHSMEPRPSALDVDLTALPCSRRYLLDTLRAATDTLGRPADVWLVHGPRYGVRHQEIAWVMQESVRLGLTSYVGLADMDHWDIATIAAELRESCSPVVAVAEPLSLLRSAPAGAIASHLAESGVGLIGFSPLASGVLTGKYAHTTPPDSRAACPHLAYMVDPYLGEPQAKIVSAAMRVAEGLGISSAGLAAAWALAQPAVTTVVIGPRTEAQLSDVLKGYDKRLPRELREALTEAALP